MNIKEVCEVTGLSADTIRYYERIGLVPKIARKSSGVRDFAENGSGKELDQLKKSSSSHPRTVDQVRFGV